MAAKNTIWRKSPDAFTPVPRTPCNAPARLLPSYGAGTPRCLRRYWITGTYDGKGRCLKTHVNRSARVQHPKAALANRNVTVGPPCPYLTASCAELRCLPLRLLLLVLL